MYDEPAQRAADIFLNNSSEKPSTTDRRLTSSDSFSPRMRTSSRPSAKKFNIRTFLASASKSSRGLPIEIDGAVVTETSIARPPVRKRIERPSRDQVMYATPVRVART